MGLASEIITVRRECDEAINWTDRRAWILVKSDSCNLVWKSCCLDLKCYICNNLELNSFVIGRIEMVQGLWAEKLKNEK